ncbi:Flp family type IVb pilin [Burkholderia pyrrocinia]|uniref:Flp family type IVb pilin n=1 Tax=Burkholderia pyrrocinia TaxID=60550 RepID=UPI0010472F36|nr:pilus assembly protein [Burkholderia pyrrocinia]TDA47473.1 pilus assembly protein [Burkholderia pyrrocinia]
MNINRFRQYRKQLGQGMTEYIIIVALIAVAAIGVYSYFGQTIRQQTAGLANELSGKDASSQIGAAQSAAQNAGTQAETDKGMGTYNGNNAGN